MGNENQMSTETNRAILILDLRKLARNSYPEAALIFNNAADMLEAEDKKELITVESSLRFNLAHYKEKVSELESDILELKTRLAQKKEAATTSIEVCITCGESEPYSGSCGTSDKDTKALCKRSTQIAQGSGEFESKWDSMADSQKTEWEGIAQAAMLLNKVKVPEGYMLVPIKPTEEMMIAAEEVEDLYKRGTPETWGKVYKVMIAATRN